MSMLGLMPDPLATGKMTFHVTIKDMPDDIHDNRNAISKKMYKYLYTIQMVHTGNLVKSRKCEPISVKICKAQIFLALTVFV